MLCCSLLYCAALLSSAMPSFLCRVVSRFVVLCRLSYAVLCCAVLFCGVLRYIVLCCDILFVNTPCGVVCCALLSELCAAVLCCVELCCVLLC